MVGINIMEEKLQQIMLENQALFSKLAGTKKKANKIILPLIIIVAIITAIYSLIHKDEAEFIIIAVAIAVVIIGILLIIRYNIINEQNKKFKQQVIPAILSAIDTSFKYNINAGHTKQEFFDSDLYNKNITDYESDNMISGMFGETAVKISNIEATRVEEIEKVVERDGRRTTEIERHTYTVFKGIFMSLDFNKHFDGITKLHTRNVFFDGCEENMDTLFNNYEKLTIENQDFNNQFDVITTDIQNALYILTPAFAELLLHLHKKINKGLGICFKNGIMYVAFEKEKFLEVDNSLDYESNMKLIYKEIANKLNIVDDLQLNNRIWTKE